MPSRAMSIPIKATFNTATTSLPLFLSRRRKHPYNLLSLLAFTLCEALLVGVAVCTYEAHVVSV